jgi:hypothetical protein
MRISTIEERPTVSIQNGKPICRRSSSENAASSCEKIVFVDVDQRRDLPRHRRRKVEIDEAPLAFDKQESDHRLGHHHRHDDDQERAGIKPLRHDQLQPLDEAIPPADDRGRKRAGGRCRGICGAEQMTGHAADASAAVLEAARGTAHGEATSR